jgi:hypothetical protein
MSRPLLLKHGLAKATFSRVHASRIAFILVLDSTELTDPTTVWSMSNSSRDASSVTLSMIWLYCGDSSRSQRTPQVLLALIWWSPRMTVFQTRVFSVVVVLKFGRVGMLIVTPSSMMKRSRLKKKCALSLMIGPPTVPPMR